ncbi:hypothetical protein BpHYR1_043232 [Brachionus plicatilis]|uniref:Uncharacterized protein n=1 Tax=Brachionus plicatilis TaxID=10195 RepID=A0A3M7QCM1_BRAPC|nr:hypothetical protein BpHYR1_043232 [Brachionus plicatilis]
MFVRDISFQLVKWIINKRTMETLVATLYLVIGATSRRNRVQHRQPMLICIDNGGIIYPNLVQLDSKLLCNLV